MTLAVLFAQKGRDVALLSPWAEEAETLRSAGESPRQPGLAFPDTLRVTADGAGALRDAEIVVLAVPSQTMRENARGLAEAIDRRSVVLSAVKGLERETSARMSEVLRQEWPWLRPERLCVLSGPNLSREIAAGLPAATVVASRDAATAELAQDALMGPALRVYASVDVIGVELGGALKNIIAIGAGLADGMGGGDNAKAAFVTRGLAEITRLGVAAGADPLTFAGLAGMGDLVATCYSRLSRNRYVGEELAKGRAAGEILASMDAVAEGVETARAALDLAKRLQVDMPITQSMCQVLFEGKAPPEAVAELMARGPSRELRGMRRS